MENFSFSTVANIQECTKIKIHYLFQHKSKLEIASTT